MQFYWRIIEELRYLGETVIFHDPSLERQYYWWLRKNAVSLALSRESGGGSKRSVVTEGIERFTSLN
jgi:hypothetical protein